ncbi:hypothetical protein [Lactobacillus selangorensis]|nr:hypothetical protein [Lactobacillus selangorensis]
MTTRYTAELDPLNGTNVHGHVQLELSGDMLKLWINLYAATPELAYHIQLTPYVAERDQALIDNAEMETETVTAALGQQLLDVSAAQQELIANADGELILTEQFALPEKLQQLDQFVLYVFEEETAHAVAVGALDIA